MQYMYYTYCGMQYTIHSLVCNTYTVLLYYYIRTLCRCLHLIHVCTLQCVWTCMHAGDGNSSLCLEVQRWRVWKDGLHFTGASRLAVLLPALLSLYSVCRSAISTYCNMKRCIVWNTGPVHFVIPYKGILAYLYVTPLQVKPLRTCNCRGVDLKFQRGMLEIWHQ